MITVSIFKKIEYWNRYHDITASNRHEFLYLGGYTWQKMVGDCHSINVGDFSTNPYVSSVVDSKGDRICPKRNNIKNIATMKMLLTILFHYPSWDGTNKYIFTHFASQPPRRRIDLSNGTCNFIYLMKEMEKHQMALFKEQEKVRVGPARQTPIKMFTRSVVDWKSREGRMKVSCLEIAKRVYPDYTRVPLPFFDDIYFTKTSGGKKYRLCDEVSLDKFTIKPKRKSK